MNLLILLFILSATLNITQSSFQNPTTDIQSIKDISQFGDCTPGQLTAITAAITTCQVSDLDTTTECISNQMQKTYSQQQWNAFAKNTESNKDTVVFWRFKNCYANLVNYGKYNRTYVTWPGKAYLNSTQETTQTQSQAPKTVKISSKQRKQSQQPSTKSLQTQNLEADCPAWKISTAQTIINGCSLQGNEAAANCIFERTKEEMGDYWNVLVQTSIFGTSYSIFLVSGCAVQTDGSDAYHRYYVVWRGH